MIRVLIVDDSTAIREGLSSLLNSSGEFQVVGYAEDGLDAVEKAGDLLPDVVIMDAQIPNMDGVEATKRIKQAFPGISVLFLSVFSSYLEDSIAAGANGFLLKDCEPEELISELKRVAPANRLER